MRVSRGSASRATYEREVKREWIEERGDGKARAVRNWRQAHCCAEAESPAPYWRLEGTANLKGEPYAECGMRDAQTECADRRTHDSSRAVTDEGRGLNDAHVATHRTRLLPFCGVLY
jgi:hypothetical protein